MKNKPEPLSLPDADLFRNAIKGVVAITSPNRINLTPPLRRVASPPILALPTADPLSDHGAGAVPLNEFLRPGISRMILRKLRRGQIPLQDSLDLHGLTSDEARKLLLEFLLYTSKNDLRHVSIIHGKGWHTDGGEGILKTRTRHWLTQCPEVLAFCEAPPNAGGGGAVRVLLKSNK